MTTSKILNNNNYPLLCKVIAYIVGLTIAASTAWAVVNLRVVSHESRLNLHDMNFDKLNTRIRSVENFNTEQRVHNEWTRATLIRIEKKISE